MSYKKSIIENIKKRISDRTFESKEITEEHYDLIKNYISEEKNLISPLGNRIKFELIDVKDNNTGKGLKIGTYGIIKNPQAYIAGITKKDKISLIEFGYIFEKLVLFLTELGIGTCWLGGTFTRDSFEREIEYKSDEIIPCVTPIGYPKNKKRLLEKTMRALVKANNRKDWESLFYDNDFNSPLSKENSDIYAVPIEMVRLGPSASNKQPWRIVLSKDRKNCHFYLEHTPNYGGSKMGFDMQVIDMGIAMCHFDLTCRELNMDGEWKIDNPNITLPKENMEYMISWHLN
ncbi:nitroreductase family protein [Sporosalibacterium faouarense]|uniref:nitroreductase family protein n=1 Tax=Sporosalibacterium faouarense TaxID=516123 RepID=UPI00192B0C62|nr:nitroreductase family protein [Sporosalibacterium faouarense]